MSLVILNFTNGLNDDLKFFYSKYTRFKSCVDYLLPLTIDPSVSNLFV